MTHIFCANWLTHDPLLRQEILTDYGIVNANLLETFRELPTTAQVGILCLAMVWALINNFALAPQDCFYLSFSSFKPRSHLLWKPSQQSSKLSSSRRL